ncbi:MAG: hypothetical protein Q4D87_08340 [Actinomycetaceae bacterium]|nr:hypothetical protein [Actinomycetaceae bacterium]
MIIFAIIAGVVLVLIATVAVALTISIARGFAWNGSALHLPVQSDDPEVVRHVHRASLPLIVATAFIAVAHGATLLALTGLHVSGSPQSAQLLGLIVLAGIVTCAGLIGVLAAYVRKPHVNQ